jgi:hypothetical protein
MSGTFARSRNPRCLPAANITQIKAFTAAAWAKAEAEEKVVAQAT